MYVKYITILAFPSFIYFGPMSIVIVGLKMMPALSIFLALQSGVLLCTALLESSSLVKVVQDVGQ